MDNSLYTIQCGGTTYDLSTTVVSAKTYEDGGYSAAAMNALFWDLNATIREEEPRGLEGFKRLAKLQENLSLIQREKQHLTRAAALDEMEDLL